MADEDDDDILDPAEEVKSIPPEHAERLRRRRHGYDRVYQLIRSFDKLPPDTLRQMAEVDLSENYVQPLFQALGWSVLIPTSLAEGSVASFDLELEYQNLKIPLDIKGAHDPLDLRVGSLRQWRGGTTWAIVTNFETIQIWDLDQEELILDTSPHRYIVDDQEKDDLLAAPIFYERLAQPRFAQSSDRARAESDSSVPGETAETVTTSEDSGESEGLIAALSDPNESIRQRAIEALGRIGHARAIEPLLGMLSDSNERIRQTAVEALGQIADPRAVEPLIGILSDSNKSIRRAAIEALGRIGDPLAARPLITLLSDSNDSIRLAAVEALGQMKISQAAEPLTRALEDENASIRQAVAEALEKIGAPPGAPVPDTGQKIAVAARALSDAPSEVDLLGFSVYAEALADFIKNEKTEKPLTIGIDAVWGMGKTTLMCMVEKRLSRQGEDAPCKPERKPSVRSEDALLTVWFNAWKYDEAESLWAALVLAILDQVREQLTWRERWMLWVDLNRNRFAWSRFVQSVLKSMAYFVGVVLLALAILGTLWWAWGSRLTGVVQEIWTENPGAFLGGAGLITLLVSLVRSFLQLLKRPFDLSINDYLQEQNYKEKIGFLAEFDQDYRRVIELVTHSGKWPLVLFIDDLDRCAPPKPAEIIEAVNLLLDARHCVFIIGMDYKMVSCSIEARYKDLQEHLEKTATPGDLTLGQHFLEKIAQITFRIPRADEQHIESFIDTLLVRTSEESSHEPVREKVEQAEQLIKAEQRTGLTLDEATDVVRAGRQDLPSEAVTEARQQIFARSFDDSEEVRTAIHGVAPYLSRNPRKIKRFMNVFRLQAFIANRRGLLESGAVRLGSLAKWTTIALRWPAMIDALNVDRDFVPHLMAAHATEKELRGLEQKYGTPSADKRGNLQIQLEGFLSDPRMAQLVQAGDLIRLLENMTVADIEAFPCCLYLAQTTMGTA